MSVIDMKQAELVLGVYDRIRSYLEHEDKLVNDRISRTLLLHGFLLASGVLLVQSRVEAVAKCLGRDKGCWTQAAAVTDATLLPPDQLPFALLLVDVLLPVIAMIGIVTTLAAQRGVKAADLAMASVRAHWERFATEHHIVVSQLHLPPVTGGGVKKAEIDGHRSSYSLLRNLSGLWFLILLLNVALAFVWHWPVLRNFSAIGSWLNALSGLGRPW
jgi:hypothetical protein